MIKTYSLLFFVFVSLSVFCQKNSLNGTWINSDNASFAIDIKNAKGTLYKTYTDNTYREEKGNVYVRNKKICLKEENNLASLPHEKKYKRFVFKILVLNDSILTLSPISFYSQQFCDSNKSISFVKQSFTKDRSIKFEKIQFSYNFTNIIIDSSANIWRQDKEGKFDYKTRKRLKNTTNYHAVCSDSLFVALVTATQTCYLKTLQVVPNVALDAPPLEIIVYFNGEKKRFKAYEYPPIMNDFVLLFFKVLHDVELTKIEEPIIFEE